MDDGEMRIALLIEATGLFEVKRQNKAHVSWRDRFLLTAGHLPHPLGH